MGELEEFLNDAKLGHLVSNMIGKYFFLFAYSNAYVYNCYYNYLSI